MNLSFYPAVNEDSHNYGYYNQGVGGDGEGDGGEQEEEYEGEYVGQDQEPVENTAPQSTGQTTS